MTVVSPKQLNKTVLNEYDDVPLDQQPSFFDVTSAALQTSDTLGTAYAGFIDGFPSLKVRTNYDFDALSDLRGTPYQQYADAFMQADNEEDVARIKMKIDRRLKNEDVLAKAGMWGTVAQFGFAIADPANLTFFGAAGKAKAAYTMLKGAKNIQGAAKPLATLTGIGAYTGAASQSVFEAVDLAVNPTKDVDQAISSIGHATVFGALLGGSLAGIGKAAQAKFGKEIVDTMSPDAIKKNISKEIEADDISRGMADPMTDSVGAMRVKTKTREEQLEDTAIAGEKARWFADKFKKLTPKLALSQSESLEARNFSRMSMTQDFTYNENLEFVGSPNSIEQALGEYEALTGKNYTEGRGLWREAAAADKQRGVKPRNFLQFNEQATHAILDPQAFAKDPHVSTFADWLSNNVYGPMLERGKELGLFPENATVKNAARYFPQMWDRNAIIQNRNGLKEFFKKYLPAAFEEANRKKEFLFDKYSKLENRIKKLKPKTEAQIKNKEKLEKELLGLSNELEDYRMTETRINENDFDDVADELIMGLLNNKNGFSTGFNRIPLTKGPMKYKALDFFPQAEALPWLNRNASEVTTHYLRAVGGEFELVRKFGDVEGKEVKKRIGNEYQEMMSKTNDPKRLMKLQKGLDEDLKNVDAVIQRIRGIYGRPMEPDTLIANALSTVRVLNVATKMGKLGTSMIPDTARLTAIRGFTNVFSDAIIPMITNMKAVKMNAREAKEAGFLWGVALNNSRAFNMAELLEPGLNASPVRRFLEATTRTLSKFNLSIYVEQAQQMMASLLIQKNMFEYVNKAVNNSITDKEIGRLAASGIDRHMAGRIKRMLDNHSTVEDGVVIANANKWIDKEAVQAYRAALNRDLAIFTTKSGIGDRPKMMDSPLGKTLLQFESYNIAATSKILIAGLQDVDAKLIASWSTQISLGMMVYAMKKLADGKELSDDPREWITEGISNAGLMGVIGSANDRMSRITGGGLSASSLLGLSNPEYAVDPFRSAIGILGPSAGTLADWATIGKLFNPNNKWRAADSRAIVRSTMPFNNAMGAGMIIREFENGVNKMLGVNK